MSTLSNFVGGAIPGDPYKQPCFAVWSNQGGSYGGFSFYDHSYNCLGRFMYNNSGSYGGGSAMSSTGSPELFDTYSGQTFTRTNSYSSSNSEYGHGCYTGYLGHLVHPMAWNPGSNASGEMVGSTSYNYLARAFRDNGPIVNEIYQDYAIWIDSTQFRVGPRSSTWYAYNTQTLDYNYITVSAKQSGYSGTNYGSVSYNAKTNQMVIIESNGSYARRPVIYNNLPKLRYYANNVYRGSTEQYAAQTVATTGPLYTHLNDASNYVTTYAAQSGKPRNNGNEDNYRGVPVMCDDGSVVWYQMIPGASPNAWISRWDSSGTHSGSLKTWSGTTSYGMDQGDRYGVRYVVSSDGRYVLIHSPYYYYGAGTHVAIVRVSDGKILWDENNESNYSYYFMPNGKSDFVCLKGDNADSGSGARTLHIDTEYWMNTQGDVTQGNFCRSFITQIVGSNYYSTDYPRYIPLFYDTAAFSVGR